MLNDVLRNQASIYFDYNFPILTNETATVVQNLLSNPTFDLKDINIYPNPVKDILNIQSTSAVQKIEIFDANGRKLQSISMLNNQTDVSNLSSGVYFVKVYAEDKIGIVKISKE